MTNFEKITIVANQIANEGKKPTVALIKAKLPSPVPLPEIISSLKGWQHEPDNNCLPNLVVEEQKNKNITTEVNKVELTNYVNAEIEKALAPIKKELEEVKFQLHQLKNLN